ncbi:MAG: type II secretion system protein GspL [Candidatus Omnitrophota bacterium]
MADKRHIGVVWGDGKLALSVSAKSHAVQTYALSFEDLSLQAEPGEDIDTGILYTAALKEAMSQAGVAEGEGVHLAIPSSDLIFRAFDIPYMSREEVRNVVDFEATKYIPIDLSELAYTYHTIPFAEGGQKKLRILFLAVRRAALGDYLSILHNAGLSCTHIEPEVVSLGRALLQKQLLVKKASTAVVILKEKGSQIVIYDKDVLVFNRNLDGLDPAVPANELKSDLQNDVNVSLNFYKRQNPGADISRVIILAEEDLPGMTDFPELNTETLLVKTTEVVGRDAASLAIESLAAAGAAFFTGRFDTKNFALSDEEIQLQRSGYDPAQRMKSMALTGVFLLGAVLCIAGTFFFLGQQKTRLIEQRSRLEQKLGKYSNLKAEDIRKMYENFSTKLETYRGIRRGSDMSVLLWKVPQLLPEYAWLKDFSIDYGSYNKKTGRHALTMDLTGFVYADNENLQFLLAKDLEEIFQNDAQLKDLFSNIERKNTNQSQSGQYTVTSFTVTCR